MLINQSNWVPFPQVKDFFSKLRFGTLETTHLIGATKNDCTNRQRLVPI